MGCNSSGRESRSAPPHARARALVLPTARLRVHSAYCPSWVSPFPACLLVSSLHVRALAATHLLHHRALSLTSILLFRCCWVPRPLSFLACARVSSPLLLSSSPPLLLSASPPLLLSSSSSPPPPPASPPPVLLAEQARRCDQPRRAGGAPGLRLGGTVARLLDAGEHTAALAEAAASTHGEPASRRQQEARRAMGRAAWRASLPWSRRLRALSAAALGELRPTASRCRLQPRGVVALTRGDSFCPGGGGHDGGPVAAPDGGRWVCAWASRAEVATRSSSSRRTRAAHGARRGGLPVREAGPINGRLRLLLFLVVVIVRSVVACAAAAEASAFAFEEAAASPPAGWKPPRRLERACSGRHRQQQAPSLTSELRVAGGRGRSRLDTPPRRGLLRGCRRSGGGLLAPPPLASDPAWPSGASRPLAVGPPRPACAEQLPGAFLATPPRGAGRASRAL